MNSPARQRSPSVLKVAIPVPLPLLFDYLPVEGDGPAVPGRGFPVDISKIVILLVISQLIKFSSATNHTHRMYP